MVQRYVARMAQDDHAHRPLGRLRQRLQDDGHLVHGVGLVGLQAALGQGAGLPGRQGDADTGRSSARRSRTSKRASNYQDVQDPAITVLFKLADEDAHLAIWTTTPWTLPSNLALCVGPDIVYARARCRARHRYYVAEARLAEYPKSTRRSKCSDTSSGRELVGRTYEPLFPYFADQRAQGAFVVVMDDFVTTEYGTGIVHMAPAYGEDDYRVLQAEGIELVVRSTLNGIFTDEVPDYAGRYVKDADKAIIRDLKRRRKALRQDALSTAIRSASAPTRRSSTARSRLVRERHRNLRRPAGRERTDPLGARRRQTRPVRQLAERRDRLEHHAQPLLGNAAADLDQRRTGKMICVGSIDELEKLPAQRPDRSAREFVDQLTIGCADEEGTYRRIEEVLDCWFESGSMPYAQQHYPFENQNVFNANFPAEFIAEGLDQTRGWFYTLTCCRRRCSASRRSGTSIVNGLVLAEDGKKMSKRLRNYTPTRRTDGELRRRRAAAVPDQLGSRARRRTAFFRRGVRDMRADAVAVV